jgi:hypothetical protein
MTTDTKHETTARQILTVGDQVRTSLDRRAWWDVVAAGSRYAIMTRQAPFRPKGEYLYSIVDAQEGVRGPCNLVGNGWDVTQYRTPAIGWRLLHIKLLAGELEISHRKRVRIDITEIKPADKGVAA